MRIQLTLAILFPLLFTFSCSSENTEPETPNKTEITLHEHDWSAYFQGINGTMVFFAPQTNEMHVHNTETANVP
ncbi:MAG: hypothetical protein ACRC5C_10025, partial [Bacilli bacterium]